MSVYFHRIVRSDPIARGTSSRGAKNRISTAATSCAPPLLRGEHILVGSAPSGFSVEVLFSVASKYRPICDVFEVGGGVFGGEKSSCVSVCDYFPIGRWLIYACHLVVPCFGGCWGSASIFREF
eukprot:scaffold3614_cov123-Isochrysis_galbana.AAC.1